MAYLTEERYSRRKSLVCTLAAIALSGGAMIGLTPAATAVPIIPMGACGESFNPSTSGARAYWEIRCAGGKVTMAGWVEDTAANGRCAKVKARFENGATRFSKPACPQGDRETFKWTTHGSSMTGYLYEYDVD